ncbi:hypothetical protein [Aeromonas veronii]|uniref:hypothetical protein n=1 Tax=Aeromonas veronii TaxID=654 RepID=UPI003F7A3223
MMIYLQKRVIDQNGRSPSSFEKAKIRCGMTDINSVVDVLYKIRCDVVHEGNYWWFNFATDTRPSILSSKDGTQMIKLNIKYHDFKDIIVRGIIKATQDILQTQ